MNTVSIPVMAKARIGHFAEAQVLQALEVDFIDESEVLTPADEENHIWKHDFKVPFVCGARNLGEALRRIAEGAAMIRTKGEAGSGNIVEAVRHMRTIVSEMRRLTTLREDELGRAAKDLAAPLDLVREVARSGQASGAEFFRRRHRDSRGRRAGAASGRRSCFRRLREFSSPSDPEKRARAIVKATTHFEMRKAVLEASEELGEAMKGLDVASSIPRTCCRRAAGSAARRVRRVRRLGGCYFTDSCESESLRCKVIMRPTRACSTAWAFRIIGSHAANRPPRLTP